MLSFVTIFLFSHGVATANQVAPRDTLKGSIMNRTFFSGANVATSFVGRELWNVFRMCFA